MVLFSEIKKEKKSGTQSYSRPIKSTSPTVSLNNLGKTFADLTFFELMESPMFVMSMVGLSSKEIQNTGKTAQLYWEKRF